MKGALKERKLKLEQNLTVDVLHGWLNYSKIRVFGGLKKMNIRPLAFLLSLSPFYFYFLVLFLVRKPEIKYPDRILVCNSIAVTSPAILPIPVNLHRMALSLFRESNDE